MEAAAPGLPPVPETTANTMNFASFCSICEKLKSLATDKLVSVRSLTIRTSCMLTWRIPLQKNRAKLMPGIIFPRRLIDAKCGGESLYPYIRLLLPQVSAALERLHRVAVSIALRVFLPPFPLSLTVREKLTD